MPNNKYFFNLKMEEIKKMQFFHQVNKGRTKQVSTYQIHFKLLILI